MVVAVTRATQNLLMMLLGASVLWITLGSEEYLNYVQPWFRFVLIPAALVLITLGIAGLIRERQPDTDPAAPTPPKPGPDGDDGPADDADDSGGSGEGGDGGHGHGAGPRVAWLLCLPVVAIFVIAPPALGSFIADRETTNAAPPPPPPVEGYPPLPINGGPTQMSMAEFISRAFIAQTGDPTTLQGRQVKLTGFVTPREEGGWHLTRLRIACCAGDALPMQVIVRGQKRPPTDSWVQVVGTWSPPPDRKHVSYELNAQLVQPIKKPKKAYE
jgi:uncharacterized repeat protein (TIGR03943 family)